MFIWRKLGYMFSWEIFLNRKLQSRLHYTSSTFNSLPSLLFISLSVLPQKISIGDGVSCRPSVVSYDVTLRGGLSAGKFTPVGHVDSMEACVNLCCKRNTCDIALMLRDSCYAITCVNEELCEEVPAPSSDFYPRLSYVRRDNESQTKKGG